MSELLYTVPEAANLLKCNPELIYKHIKAGTLKALKLGRIKIRRQELESFLVRNESKDCTDPDNIRELVVS